MQIGAVLWSDFLQYNPKDPQWINRDRFVLSGGHGSMFLYSVRSLPSLSEATSVIVLLMDPKQAQALPVPLQRGGPRFRRWFSALTVACRLIVGV